MYWLTENSFQPMMIGILLGCAFLTFWFMSRKRALLIAGVLTFVVTAGIVIVEQYTITDSEQLRKDLVDLASALQSNDVDAVLGFVSPNDDTLIAAAKSEMAEVEFKSISFRRSSDPEINLNATPPTAKMSFNAIITADLSQSRRYGNVPRAKGGLRATLFYEKDAKGDWKIVDYDYSVATPADLMGTQAP